MRSVEVGEDRTLSVVEGPELSAGPGQVVVEVAACGICGSDLHFRNVPELFPAGTVPGHELAGRIAELGPGVEGWELGDRVCVLPFSHCGECEFCLAGSEQVCVEAVSNGVGLGTGRPGAYAERMVADASMLFALPESIDDRAGTLVEPLAVAVRAEAKADLHPGDPVAVLGAGPIGLLTALVLRERGFDRLVVISRNSGRAGRARALGLRSVELAEVEDGGLGEALEGEPVAVFECAGTPSAARLAVDLVRPLGQVLLVGMSLEPLDLEAPTLIIKEVDLRGALAYRRADFQEAIEMIAAGGVPAPELITGVAPLERAEEMFQELKAPGNDHIKVVLEP